MKNCVFQILIGIIIAITIAGCSFNQNQESYDKIVLGYGNLKWCMTKDQVISEENIAATKTEREVVIAEKNPSEQIISDLLTSDNIKYKANYGFFDEKFIMLNIKISYEYEAEKEGDIEKIPSSKKIDLDKYNIILSDFKNRFGEEYIVNRIDRSESDSTLKSSVWQLPNGNRISLAYNGYNYEYKGIGDYYRANERNSINISIENGKLHQSLPISPTWYGTILE